MEKSLKKILVLSLLLLMVVVPLHSNFKQIKLDQEFILEQYEIADSKTEDLPGII
ncbi:MAG: hypothetical protein JEZ08_16725 [Clostridiales bacterium]|nr:hypothetical protein [Clostridiales bacterium]